MGQASKALRGFIQDIPVSKLDGFRNGGRTMHKDQNFRLDMQGRTSHKPPKWNLQVQVNYETKISTLKGVAPDTVAGPALVTEDDTGEDIRKKLLAKMLM